MLPWRWAISRSIQLLLQGALQRCLIARHTTRISTSAIPCGLPALVAGHRVGLQFPIDRPAVLRGMCATSEKNAVLFPSLSRYPLLGLLLPRYIARLHSRGPLVTAACTLKCPTGHTDALSRASITSHPSSLPRQDSPGRSLSTLPGIYFDGGEVCTCGPVAGPCTYRPSITLSLPLTSKPILPESYLAP